MPHDQIPAPTLSPEERARRAAKSRRSRVLFFALYLGVLIFMAAMILRNLRPGRTAGLVVMVPIALVWLLMFGAALRELLRTFRRAPRGPADFSGDSVSPPEAASPAPARPAAWGESAAEREEFRHAAALQLEPGANFADVKRAYRRLVNAWRPDKAARDDLASRRIAEEKMRDIEAAYAFFRQKFGK